MYIQGRSLLILLPEGKVHNMQRYLIKQTYIFFNWKILKWIKFKENILQSTGTQYM